MRIRDFGLGIILGLLLAAGAFAYKSLNPSLPSLPSSPSKDLAKVDKETLNCIPVIVYKDKSKDKLGLPTAVVSAPEQRVLGATQVNPNERPTTVSAVLNTVSGETTFYQRLDPLPWFALETRRELGIAYGFKDDAGGAVARIFGKIDLVQIKMIRAGLLGNVDSDGDWYAGAGVSLRW